MTQKEESVKGVFFTTFVTFGKNVKKSRLWCFAANSSQIAVFVWVWVGGWVFVCRFVCQQARKTGVKIHVPIRRGFVGGKGGVKLMGWDGTGWSGRVRE